MLQQRKQDMDKLAKYELTLPDLFDMGGNQNAGNNGQQNNVGK